MSEIKFRWHRGSLKESMKTMKTFKNEEKLKEYIIAESKPWMDLEKKDISSIYTCYDHRIKWDTWNILGDGKVLGMANRGFGRNCYNFPPDRKKRPLITKEVLIDLMAHYPTY
jgi:hypothetical protein